MGSQFVESEAEEGERVPVTILTGFLGSGKTTLFNHILSATHGKKIAVIQNEFGDVGIDDRLMAKNTKLASDEEITKVLNGCICCSVRTDLVKTLKDLAKRHRARKPFLDAIVIETTGMANPAPVAQTFICDPDVRAFARLDGIVTLVDAKHVEQHLDEKKADGVTNESVQQVAFADQLLLNKVDLVPSEKDLARIETRLRNINAFAPIRRCTRSDVSIDVVLGINSFDLKRTLKRDPTFMDMNRAPTKHDDAVRSHSIDQGAARHLRSVNKGELDLNLVQKWIQDLLYTHGEDIYRMKGELAIAHSKQRFVFHAVHMLFEGTFDEPWADDEPRESRLVFIGKNLDPKALDKSFNACLVTAESRAAQIAALRFGVGDKVECNFDGAWALGEVAALMYHDDSMPAGQVAPYQVKLEQDDELVVAPLDEDCAIREPCRRSDRTNSNEEPKSSSRAHDHGHGHGRHKHMGHQHPHEASSGEGSEKTSKRRLRSRGLWRAAP